MNFESQDEYEEYLESRQEREDWEHEQYDIEKDRRNEQ
jgi:hypothetical protein